MELIKSNQVLIKSNHEEENSHKSEANEAFANFILGTIPDDLLSACIDIVAEEERKEEYVKSRTLQEENRKTIHIKP